MNKKDFVQAVSKSTKLSDQDVRKVLRAGHQVVMDVLRSGDSVNVMGLGQLMLKPRSERLARDIRRGSAVVVPAGAVMRFVPTKSVAHELRATPLDKLTGASNG